MRTIVASLLILVALMGTNEVSATPAALASAAFCSERSYDSPPKTIRVFRIHKRGSRIPAHVETMSFKTYVGRVMAAGAWPAYKPMESLKSGAVVITQRAWWMINHHDRRFHWHGRCFDIMPGSAPRWCSGCDTGQFYVGAVYVHSRIRRAVDAVWDTRLFKHGRFIKPQWSGDGGSCGRSVTGFRLPENAVTACARKGWSWKRILRHYFAPVQIRSHPAGSKTAKSSASAVKSSMPSASPTAVFALRLDSVARVLEDLGALVSYFQQGSPQVVYAVNRAIPN